MDIQLPKISTGGKHTDARGNLFYNNFFDALPVKRFYVIENKDTQTIRAWQGHQIEQRWFAVLNGSFKIRLIAVDNWENPSKDLPSIDFIMHNNQLDILHIPKGYISSIQALEPQSKLLVMADYVLGEIKDEYRYESDYFEIKERLEK
jgi:dTDP-4-dehydrorhamnose 3,5-epimerase-like enzyme